MKIFRSPKSCQLWRSQLRHNCSVGFVPTMGALHEGHLSLIRQSLQKNSVTIVSVFVNPTQFGPNEDFKKYPRPWGQDLKKLKKMGVPFLFSPSTKAMYGSSNLSHIEVAQLSNVLCGAPQFRGPEHFRGVATVVAKLFHIVRPTRAYFGMKDFQQVRVIETMVNDLNFDVQIVRCPTFREFDGLAMSSRNAYLSVAERRLAPQLYAALQHGRKLLRSHARMSPQAVCQQVKRIIAAFPEFKIEYVELVDPQTLTRSVSSKSPLVLAAAVRLGSTRLIDNILIH